MLRIIDAAPEHAPQVTVDPYVPLSIAWPARGMAGVPRLWWRSSGPRTMLETGFNSATGELEDVTLVLSGPIARVEHGPPTASSTAPGLPRCDPGEWMRQVQSGAVQQVTGNYVDDGEPVRTELGPDHLLVRIGGDDAPAARELVCGRVRFGLSGEDGLLWICVTGFAAEEHALLEQHVAWSHAPPVHVPPPAEAAGTRDWRSWLRGLGFARGG